MDPAKAQADKDNDANSLARGETEVEGQTTPEQNDAAPSSEQGVINATTGKTAAPPERPSLRQRIWQKFNLYLLLFILLVVISGGVLAALVIKDKRANEQKATIATQDLSEATLDELAKTAVNIGGPKQTLSVESNAIFTGSMLVRGDVEVAGAIKVGESLELPSIKVLGNSNFKGLQTADLAVNGPANIQGQLNVKGTVSVSGNSSFNGTLSADKISVSELRMEGDLVITKHISTTGSQPSLAKGAALGSGGTASVNGSDTAGSITINTGSSPGAGCFATLTFSNAYAETPHIVITPIGSAAAELGYYINRSSTSFSVCTTTPADPSQTFGFDYVAMQ